MDCIIFEMKIWLGLWAIAIVVAAGCSKKDQVVVGAEEARDSPQQEIRLESLQSLNWREFLQYYSAELLAADDLEFEFVNHGAATWLGYEGCSEEEIVAAEARLGVTLPKSLREFYAISNGWRQIGYFVWEIVPIQRLNWLRTVDPDFCAMIEGGYDVPELLEHREEQELSVLRSLCLGQEGDATTLLIDPENQTGEGEWVVGTWASWTPGMEWSGVGFREYLEEELKSFIDLRDGRREE